jgi:ribonuclease HII
MYILRNQDALSTVIKAGLRVQGRVVVLCGQQLAVVVHGQQRAREEDGCLGLLEALFEVIKAEAASYSIAFATVEEIEELNILNATMLAMKRAVESLPQQADYAMIDGNRLPDLSIDCETIVKGDAKSHSIACASILAKVSRDRLLYEYAKEYPQYHFDKHKGYGTKLHVEALRAYGPCPVHRMSFLKKILK